MRKLISKKVYKVERLWCYNRFYTANITGLLYFGDEKVLVVEFISTPIYRSKGSIYRKALL